MAMRWLLLVGCILAVVGEEPVEEKRALGGLIACPTCERYTKAWNRFVDSFTPFWHGRADDVLQICKERAPERLRRCQGATSSFKHYVLSVHAAWKQGSNMCKAIFPCADHIPGPAGLEKHSKDDDPDGITMSNSMMNSETCRLCMTAYEGVYALEEKEFFRMYDVCVQLMESEKTACEALIPVNLMSAEEMCIDMGMCVGRT